LLKHTNWFDVWRFLFEAITATERWLLSQAEVRFIVFKFFEEL